MRWGIITLLATIALILFMFYFNVKPVKAEAMHGDKPVRGWFWYEDPAKNEDKAPETKQPKPEKKEEESKKEEEKDFEFPVLDTAPPIMKSFLKDPTEENAKEYLAWQYKYFEHVKQIGYSLRNAYLRFGGDLYPLNGYPENPMASVYYHGAKDDMLKSVIKRFTDKLGLIYFYSTSCLGCQHQKDIILSLQDKYDLSIRGVAVDGEIDPGLPFPSSYNARLIDEFHVTQIPTLIAVLDKDGSPRIAGISAGFTPLDAIEQQLVRFLVHEGVVDEKELNPWARQ